MRFPNYNSILKIRVFIKYSTYVSLFNIRSSKSLVSMLPIMNLSKTETKFQKKNEQETYIKSHIGLSGLLSGLGGGVLEFRIRIQRALAALTGVENYLQKATFEKSFIACLTGIGIFKNSVSNLEQ